MNKIFQSKLERLKDNYCQVKGQTFENFFCPILFKDENVPLCKAHIVNQAFTNSSRAWTIQREDVDNFFGSVFEADFVGIQFHENWNPGNTITDKKLLKRFNPKFFVDGKPVEFYVADSKIPENFTPVEFDNEGKTIRLGLKMSPKDMLAVMDKDWEITISKDLRIPTFVSLIKAAHLTLFEMLGYNYALTTGGYFVGHQILGKYFLQNSEKPKSEALENAYPFFREFAHMVRPIQSSAINFQGTITDRLMLICQGNNTPPWAFIVIIKTSQSLHAVMIPIFDQPDSVATFLRFLQDDNDSIETNLIRFEQDHWEINKESTKLPWPKNGVLYPK